MNNMSLHDYLEKQRAKPVKERERLAVIWTAAAFAVILVIWVVSFREMSKPEEVQQADPAAASLNDLKNNFNDGKDSIQSMMQQLPASPTDGGSDTQNNNQAPADDSANNNTNQNNSDAGVPQLP